MSPSAHLPAFLAKPSAKLSLEQDRIFLHPSSDGPHDDPIVRGTVHLSLPRRRALHRIRVTIEGLCGACGGDKWKYESSRTLLKTLELDLKGESFGAGSHTFDFSFIIPSSTAVYERSGFGTVGHQVKASIEFYSGLNRILSCRKLPLYLSSSPVPPGDLPEPLEEHLQHFSDDLGPLAVTFSSPHLTVASLVKTSVTLFAPPASVIITSIRTQIAPAFTITYADPSQVAQPRARRYPLAQILHPASNDAHFDVLSALDQAYPPATPLALLEEGKEWRWERIMRMPDDDTTRPSTHKASDTRIRVRNKILVEIRYRNSEGDGKERHLTVGKKVHVASCCCLLEGLILPAYSPSAPKLAALTSSPRCLCRFTLAEMWARDGLALERADMPHDLSAWNVLGEEGDSKSALAI